LEGGGRGGGGRTTSPDRIEKKEIRKISLTKNTAQFMQCITASAKQFFNTISGKKSNLSHTFLIPFSNLNPKITLDTLLPRYSSRPKIKK